MANNEEYYLVEDHTFKVVLVGDTCVGKSSLLLRYADNVFGHNNLSTLGTDYRVKTIIVRDKLCQLQIWDTVGMERYSGIANNYFRGAHGVLICYDVTKAESFENVRYWAEECSKYAPAGIRKFIVGTKTDLSQDRVIFRKQALALSNQLGISILETSAKLNTNVDTTFYALTAYMMQMSSAWQPYTVGTITIGQEPPVDDSGWC